MMSMRELTQSERYRAELRIVTPHGDKIRILPGPGRRQEVYEWVVKFMESMRDPGADVPRCPFVPETEGKGKDEQKKG